MTPKPDPPVEERHRRMATGYEGDEPNADWVKHWLLTGSSAQATDGAQRHWCEYSATRAQRIATVERDARAEGVAQERAVTVLGARNFGIDLDCGSCASRFYTGFTDYPHDPSCKTDEFAHRIRALLPEPARGEAKCCGECDLQGLVSWCPLHGTKDGPLAASGCNDPDSDYCDRERCPVHGTKGGER